MDGFKVPQTIPQDLLLIQEFVDVPLASNSENIFQRDVEDDISSSSSEDEVGDSSEEIASSLKTSAATDGDEDPKVIKNALAPSDSSSDTSSDSDSESESSESNEETVRVSNERHVLQDVDDDEDPLPVPSSSNYFATKNEVSELEISVPEVEEVGPEERLEKVGEIMNIVDRVVIVRGLPSQYLNHASERALDSDTLLILDDRRVLGYIYETFGPTMQPLYQVKFCESFPLDHERVTIGREVFHVPSRSNFVFVSQIKALRGSDASNVHDEEPEDDDLEFFSDDEAETAYRNSLKRRRGDSRHRSAASSRSTTPNPTFMRDEELAADEVFMSGHAYDEHEPYDIDYAGVPPSSRPTPSPYDDPYADSYNLPDVTEPEGPMGTTVPRVSSSSVEHLRPSRGRKHGNRGRGFDERGQRSRGRVRNPGRQHQTSPALPSMPHEWTASSTLPHHEEYSPLYPEQRTLYPMPLENSYPMPYVSQPQNYLQQFGVQPHINPRFASAFGLSMYPSTNSAPQGYTAGTQTYLGSSQLQYGTTNWTDGWSVPMRDGSADSRSESTHGE